MIPGIISSFNVSGGGGTGYAALMSLLQTYNPYMLFGLDDPSGSVATNSGTGTNGSYSGGHTLGDLPLIPGASGSYLVTDSTGRASYPGASVPSCPNGLTIGAFIRITSAGGQHPIINRDDGGFGATRFWQFRLDGANIQMIQIRSGVSDISGPHGRNINETIFCATTYRASDGEARLFVNGSQVGSTGTFPTGIDLGGTGIAVVVGNFDGFSAARSGDYYNTAFAIGQALTPAQIMDIWTTSGVTP